jgi:N-acyl-D-aspartate/D-glutamate deacylase
MKNIFKRATKNSMKTLDVKAAHRPKQCARELNNLKLWSTLKEPSKKIQKKMRVNVLFIKDQDSVTATPMPAATPALKLFRERPLINWVNLIKNLHIQKRIENSIDVNNHFRKKFIKNEEWHTKEILDLNE